MEARMSRRGLYSLPGYQLQSPGRTTSMYSLPRYQSPSPVRLPREFSLSRSRSRSRSRIMYVDGESTRVTLNSYPNSDRPKVSHLIGGKSDKHLVRKSRSSSEHDLLASHLYLVKDEIISKEAKESCKENVGNSQTVQHKSSYDNHNVTTSHLVRFQDEFIKNEAKELCKESLYLPHDEFIKNEVKDVCKEKVYTSETVHHKSSYDDHNVTTSRLYIPQDEFIKNKTKEVCKKSLNLSHEEFLKNEAQDVCKESVGYSEIVEGKSSYDGHNVTTSHLYLSQDELITSFIAKDICKESIGTSETETMQHKSSHLYLSQDKFIKNEAEEVCKESVGNIEVVHQKSSYDEHNVTTSESGVSFGDSDVSFSDVEDEIRSHNYSHGSSSAFFDMTADSELDRFDSDNVHSDNVHSGGELHHIKSRKLERGRQKSSDDNSLSYSDMRRKELSSPSWDSNKLQTKFTALNVEIPEDKPHSSSASRDNQKSSDSKGVLAPSVPIAHSTPHVSPNRNLETQLSIKCSWNVDDPNIDEKLDEKQNENKPKARERFLMDLSGTERLLSPPAYSSCNTSFSEDNLSDVSNLTVSSISSVPRKTKRVKKPSDLPARLRDTKAFSTENSPTEDRFPYAKIDLALDYQNTNIEGETSDTVEEIIKVTENDETRHSAELVGDEWWSVYNIGTAQAREDDKTPENTEEVSDYSTNVKVVKPGKIAIPPLITAGEQLQEKLRRRSVTSTPPSSSRSSLSSSPVLQKRNSPCEMTNREQIKTIDESAHNTAGAFCVYQPEEVTSFTAYRVAKCEAVEILNEQESTTNSSLANNYTHSSVKVSSSPNELQVESQKGEAASLTPAIESTFLHLSSFETTPQQKVVEDFDIFTTEDSEIKTAFQPSNNQVIPIEVTHTTLKAEKDIAIESAFLHLSSLETTPQPSSVEDYHTTLNVEKGTVTTHLQVSFNNAITSKVSNVTSSTTVTGSNYKQAIVAEPTFIKKEERVVTAPSCIEVQEVMQKQDTGRAIQFETLLNEFDRKLNALEAIDTVDGVAPSNTEDMYEAFTNEDAEKNQNSVCIVLEDESMPTLRFKRFLGKWSTKRTKNGDKVFQLSRQLNGVSEGNDQSEKEPSSPVFLSPESSSSEPKFTKKNIGNISRSSRTDSAYSSISESSFDFPLISGSYDQKKRNRNSDQNLQRSRTDSAFFSISDSALEFMRSPTSCRQDRLSSSVFSSGIVGGNLSDRQPCYEDIGRHTGETFTFPGHTYTPEITTEDDDFSKNNSRLMSSSPLPRLKTKKDKFVPSEEVFENLLDFVNWEIDPARLNRLRYGHRQVEIAKTEKATFLKL